MSRDSDRKPPRSSVPGVFNWGLVRKALRAAEEGVYCWNIASGEIYYTEQCIRMMGLPVQEFAPNIFTAPELTIHEEDRQYFINTVQRYLDRPTSAPMRLEVRLLNQRSRGWRWIRVNGLVEQRRDKKAVQLVGVWVDITRRKMTDMHAMEDRDLFRNLINYLPDNIYYKNRESRFVMANEATARKMGVRTPSDLIGCKDTHFFSDDTTAIARQEELEIMQTGKPITNRIHKESWKDGESSWCKLSKFPWYAADGSIKGIVGISSDVTELVETQQRYRRMAEQLDQRNRALEKEISLAREIQQALQSQRIPNREWKDEESKVHRMARFHHMYLPCTGVAGDCFEVFPVGDSGVGMLICDVMGHGVRAALIAAMLRGLLEQFVSLADTPGLFLSNLNRQLWSIFERAHLTMFTTACYVYLDLQKRRLTLSTAGHPAPIILGADGRAFQPLMRRSPALGLLENAPFRETDIPLEDGMKLMLFTDGLPEAHNPEGDEFGVPRIIEFLQQNSPQNIKEMLDFSLAGMHRFTQNPGQDDDICLLGLEFVEQKPGL
ncbi:MAG: SpoIIE family protein phosphatase [Akkermansia sp.]|nr:SpoIIE family protein phosphatase [Akkermansia sp.]MBQ7024936.1 SpoIIE family protein phosphatase [Akkermansia sp.]